MRSLKMTFQEFHEQAVEYLTNGNNSIFQCGVATLKKAITNLPYNYPGVFFGDNNELLIPQAEMQKKLGSAYNETLRANQPRLKETPFKVVHQILYRLDQNVRAGKVFKCSRETIGSSAQATELGVSYQEYNKYKGALQNIGINLGELSKLPPHEVQEKVGIAFYEAAFEPSPVTLKECHQLFFASERPIGTIVLECGYKIEELKGLFCKIAELYPYLGKSPEKYLRETPIEEAAKIFGDDYLRSLDDVQFRERSFSDSESAPIKNSELSCDEASPAPEDSTSAAKKDSEFPYKASPVPFAPFIVEIKVPEISCDEAYEQLFADDTGECDFSKVEVHPLSHPAILNPVSGSFLLWSLPAPRESNLPVEKETQRMKRTHPLPEDVSFEGAQNNSSLRGSKRLCAKL